MRCGPSGTSGHVTVKSSFCDWDGLYKSGAYAGKVLLSYPGRSAWCPVRTGLRGARALLTAVQKSAEGKVEAEASKARTV